MEINKRFIEKQIMIPLRIIGKESFKCCPASFNLIVNILQSRILREQNYVLVLFKTNQCSFEDFLRVVTLI